MENRTLKLEKETKQVGDVFYFIYSSSTLVHTIYGGNIYTDQMEYLNKQREEAENKFNYLLEIFKTAKETTRETIITSNY